MCAVTVQLMMLPDGQANAHWRTQELDGTTECMHSTVNPLLIAGHTHTQDEGIAASSSQLHDTMIPNGKYNITSNPYLCVRSRL